LHWLGEILDETAQEASRAGDERRAKQWQEVAAALLVIGVGVDSTSPHE
jgi:hypothetical protein